MAEPGAGLSFALRRHFDFENRNEFSPNLQ
jgi:hypothetical protein